MRNIVSRIIALFLFALPLAFVADLAQAQEAPDALVKRLAEETLTAIRADKDLSR